MAAARLQWVIPTRLQLKGITMGKAKQTGVVSVEQITHSILVFRGHKVLLDSDLAELYGVPTKALNQAVKRNAERFPEDFMFRLSQAEAEALNRSQLVTGSLKIGSSSWFLASRGDHFPKFQLGRKSPSRSPPGGLDIWSRPTGSKKPFDLAAAFCSAVLSGWERC